MEDGQGPNPTFLNHILLSLQTTTKKATDFWKFPPLPIITEGKVNGRSETRELSNH